MSNYNDYFYPGRIYMKKKKLNTPLFKQYLYSYILILTIPIVILSFIYIKDFEDLQLKKHSDADLYALTAARDFVDYDMRKISDTVILMDKNLFPHTYTKRPLKGMTLINELKSIATISNFYEDILVYFYGDQLAYSTTTSINKDMINNDHSSSDIINWTSALLLSSLKELRSEVICQRTSTRNNGNVSIVLPFPYNSTVPRGNVAFLLSDYYFHHLFKDSNQNNPSMLFILNEEDELIYTNLSQSLQAQPIISQFSNALIDGQTTVITINKGRNMVSSISSDLNQWRFIKVTPEKAVLANAFSVRRYVFRLITVVFFIGVLLSVILSNIHYSPIKNLKELVIKQLNWGDMQKESHSELDIIHLAFNDMDIRYNQLQNQVERSKVAVYNFLISNILRNDIHLENYWYEECENAGIHIKSPYYCAFVIYYLSDIKEDYHISLLELLHSSSAHMTSYCYEPVDFNGAVGFITLDNQNEEEISNYFTLILKVISCQLSTSLVVGLGSICSELHEISTSYMEAYKSCEYRFYSSSNIIFYKDIECTLHHKSHKHNYPLQELNKLELIILNDDIDLLKICIRNLITYIKDSQLSVFESKCICYDIVSTVFKAIQVGKSKQLIPQSYCIENFSLMAFDTVDEMEEMVLTICGQVNTLIQKNNTKIQSDQWEDYASRFTEYINANYTDKEFTVYNMAAHFHISPSKLSKLFKKTTGKSISNTVTQLKLNKAKEMLIESDVSINELVDDIGYCDVSSFIRKFKKHVGITPGTYRKINK